MNFISHVHVLEYEKMIEFLRDILENNSSYYNATLVERAARFWYRSASCPGLGNDIAARLSQMGNDLHIKKTS